MSASIKQQPTAAGNPAHESLLAKYMEPGSELEFHGEVLKHPDIAVAIDHLTIDDLAPAVKDMTKAQLLIIVIVAARKKQIAGGHWQYRSLR